MNCEPISGLLSAYLDDQLSVSERQSVAEHLAICIECDIALSDYRRFDALLARLPYLVPPSSLETSLETPLHNNSSYQASTRYRLPHMCNGQKFVVTRVPLLLRYATDMPVHTMRQIHSIPHAQDHGTKKQTTNSAFLLFLSTFGLLLVYYFCCKKR